MVSSGKGVLYLVWYNTSSCLSLSYNNVSTWYVRVVLVPWIFCGLHLGVSCIYLVSYEHWYNSRLCLDLYLVYVLCRVSCILYLLSCILYLVSCILYLVSFILYLVSCILCLVSCVLYLVSCILSLVSCVLYIVSCTCQVRCRSGGLYLVSMAVVLCCTGSFFCCVNCYNAYLVLGTTFHTRFLRTVGYLQWTVISHCCLHIKPFFLPNDISSTPSVLPDSFQVTIKTNLLAELKHQAPN